MRGHTVYIFKNFAICFIFPEVKVAGFTTDYVNKILEKLNKGPVTGLDD